MFIAILIIIVLILIYSTNKNEIKNEIKNTNKNEIKNIIKNTIKPPINFSYFYNMDTLDLSVRKHASAQQYLKTYLKSICPFTNDEFKRIRNIYHSIKLPYILQFNVLICKLNTSDTPELKWPHTMGNCIMMPTTTLQVNDRELKHTIIHELVHIYQRHNHDHVETLLQDMGFFRTKDIKQPANPDIVHTYTYHDVLMYTRYSTDGSYVDSIDFKSDLQQQGHPYEIMAECIARIISNEGFIRPDWKIILNEWIQ
jgi:hypothetical protein